MKIGILGRPESWYARDLQRAAQALGHSAEAIPFERLAARVSMTHGESVSGTVGSLATCDAAIVRTMPPGSLEQVVFRMDALRELERRGIPLMNPPFAVEAAGDKYLTTARLHAAGLPVPETVVCESASEALLAFDQLGGDVVVKPLFGSEGRGIVRVSDPDLALRTFRTIERTQSILYLQRFIAHPGRDVRVMVLDGKVLGGMMRHSPDDFRTNVSRNGRAEKLSLNSQQEEWAIRAAEAVGCRLAGIDLLYDEAGQGYVIEVNGVPGWQAFRRVTGIDVARLVIQSLAGKDDGCEYPQ